MRVISKDQFSLGPKMQVELSLGLDVGGLNVKALLKALNLGANNFEKKPEH
jgi:hypothetical protein